jgi:hypothetical protein
LDKTRGFIYEYDLVVVQSTHRWIGYVGNITGNVTLRDDVGNQLYAWNMNITTGEIYATRFTGGSTTLAGGGQQDTDHLNEWFFNYVDWNNMSCANRTHIETENTALGHNTTFDNDALEVTFVNSTDFKTNAMNFEVADRYIGISDDVDGGCSGLFLYNDSGVQSNYWQMVVLEDGYDDYMNGDIVYAAIIEDDKVGFNGKEYDFQIMLPQYGNVLTGSGQARDNNIQSSLTYYFYVELVGEGWPGYPYSS